MGQPTSSLSLSQDFQNIFIGLQNGQIQKWSLLSSHQPKFTIDTELPTKHLNFEDSPNEPMDIDLGPNHLLI